MAILIIPAFLVLAWLLWVGMYFGSLRQMNAGARLFQEKRYEEAKAHFRRLLTRHLSTGLEADTRRRLADTLDVLGRTEEAAAERERAEAASARSPKDAQAQSVRGDLLRRRHQFDDACGAYTEALKQTPPSASSGRAMTMAKLSTAHYDAGRPVEASEWAEAALTSRPNPTVRLLMHRMAGVSYADIGDLEKAEAHYHRSLELAETAGKPEEIAQSLATLADVQRKHGKLMEAISAGRRAVEAHDSPFRAGRMVEMDSLREMGRFEEARAVIVRMRQGPRHDRPDVEQRMQATCALALAWVEAVADRPEASLSALGEARECLKVAANPAIWPPPPSSGEDKLAVFCDAAALRAHAELGHREDAQKLRTSLEIRLPRYATDRATLMVIYGAFSQAAFLVGDLAESLEFWKQYMDCKPSLVGLPGAYYWRGEIALRLGETDSARESFRQALAPGIDSIYARRAQARLDELGG